LDRVALIELQKLSDVVDADRIDRGVGIAAWAKIVGEIADVLVVDSALTPKFPPLMPPLFSIPIRLMIALSWSSSIDCD
jgi:hypothetical protein